MELLGGDGDLVLDQRKFRVKVGEGTGQGGIAPIKRGDNSEGDDALLYLISGVSLVVFWGKTAYIESM